MAAAANTTVRHIIHNRLVDGAARRLATRIAPIDPAIWPTLQAAIRSHQHWLVRLHELLPTAEPSAIGPTVQELPDTLSPEQCKIRYPEWLWDARLPSFTWKPKLPKGLPMPANWPATPEDWTQICDFLRGLRWRVGEQYSFSFCELAAVFHQTGHRVSLDAQLLTFREVTNMIRKAMQILSKDSAVDAFPGIFNSTRPRSCGRVMPQGCIDHAIPYVTPEGYQLIAHLLGRGAGRTLESWEIPVCDF